VLSVVVAVVCYRWWWRSCAIGGGGGCVLSRYISCWPVMMVALDMALGCVDACLLVLVVVVPLMVVVIMMYGTKQCWGSVTFLCGSGSAPLTNGSGSNSGSDSSFQRL
jgi:hypothetical protein